MVGRLEIVRQVTSVTFVVSKARKSGFESEARGTSLG
ncbi:DUF3622 domain-containing protein [Vibrio metschnikovii]